MMRANRLLELFLLPLSLACNSAPSGGADLKSAGTTDSARKPPAEPPIAFAPPDVGPGVDFVQVDQLRADKFALTRAVARVPNALAKDPVKLRSIFDQLNVQVAPADWGGDVIALHSKAKKAPPRVRPQQPFRYLSVLMPAFSGSDAEAFVTGQRPGKAIRAGSPAGWSTLAAVLRANERVKAIGGDAATIKFSPDFVAEPAQLFLRSEEGWRPSFSDNDYWRITRLREAWPLALAAAAASPSIPRRSVTVALVDQGFKSKPFGMLWDLALGAAMDEPSYYADTPWHGTDCGSVLNASVNDKKGAAGSAMLSRSSVLPTIPPMLPVQTLAAVMPRRAVTLQDLATGIEASVFTGGADIVSVSYSTWCDGWCQDHGGAENLEGVLDAVNNAGAAVVFAAGNNGKELHVDGGGPYLVGCNGSGRAVCAGAINRSGYPIGISNWGPPVDTWGPGDFVDVNPLPEMDPEMPRYLRGTSAAAPFVAGVLALVESAWGRTMATRQLLPLIKNSSRNLPGTQESKHDSPVLDARALLDANLSLSKDSIEPNDTLAQCLASAKAELPVGTAKHLLTLHSSSDVDYFRITTTGCAIVSASVHYVPLPQLDRLSLALFDGQGKTTDARGIPFLSGSRPPEPGLQVIDAILPRADRYCLKVEASTSDGASQPSSTAYAIDLTLLPDGPGCPRNSNPPPTPLPVTALR